MKKIITTLALSVMALPSFSLTDATVSNLGKCPIVNTQDQYDSSALITGGSMYRYEPV